MSQKSLSLSLAAFGLVAFGISPSQAGVQDHKPGKNFEPVYKLFQEKCVSCHNDKNHSANVDLSSYDAVMKSGGDKPVIVPKEPEKSNLVAYIEGTRKPQMPFKGQPLKSDQIELVKKWIKEGAKN